MEKEQEQALIVFLQENKDIFAWKPSDMPGVPRELAEHSLNVNPLAKPVKQPLRRFHDDHRCRAGRRRDHLSPAHRKAEVLLLARVQELHLLRAGRLHAQMATCAELLDRRRRRLFRQRPKCRRLLDDHQRHQRQR